MTDRDYYALSATTFNNGNIVRLMFKKFACKWYGLMFACGYPSVSQFDILPPKLGPTYSLEIYVRLIWHPETKG